MQKKYLIGNWKMYKTVQEAVSFMQQLLPRLQAISPLSQPICDAQFLGEAQSRTAAYSGVFEEHRQVSTPKLPLEIELRKRAIDTCPLALYIAPSFVHLSTMAALIEGQNSIQLVAQNCHQEAEGAFTGEVAAAMLAAIGVGGVLIGHSERRSYHKEDNLLLAKKIKSVLAAGMQPFLCCGESLEARRSGRHKAMVQQQLQESLAGLREIEKLVIAYEPVWAIGTGQVASLEVITEMHTFINAILSDQYGGETVPILYGGSCNAQNAKAIFECPNVAGGLIGAASLQVDSFMEIVIALLESKDGTGH